MSRLTPLGAALVALAWLAGAAPARAVTITGATAASCGLPPRVLVEWDPPAADVIAIAVEVGTAPSGTDFVRTAFGTSHLVEGLAPARAYYFRVRTTHAGGGTITSAEVSADTPRCSDALLRSSVVTTTDTCPSGGAGHGDGSVDPGEVVRLRVRVANDGTAPAPMVVLRPTSRSAFVTARTSALVLGDVAPGAFADGTVEVDASVTAWCGEPLELLLRADSAFAAFADLVDLPRSVDCVHCRMAACAVSADASRTAPRAVCNGSVTTLDAGASSAGSCSGVLVFEWRDESGGLVSSSPAASRAPDSSTTYELTARCSTDLGCVDVDTVAVSVNDRPRVSIAESPAPPHCAPTAARLTATCWDPRRDVGLERRSDGRGARRERRRGALGHRDGLERLHGLSLAPRGGARSARS